jgi:hypothetical protein
MESGKVKGKKSKTYRAAWPVVASIGPLTSSQLMPAILPSLDSSQRTAHISFDSGLRASSALGAADFSAFSALATLGGILELVRMLLDADWLMAVNWFVGMC